MQLPRRVTTNSSQVLHSCSLPRFFGRHTWQPDKRYWTSPRELVLLHARLRTSFVQRALLLPAMFHRQCLRQRDAICVPACVIEIGG
jgi:hypothetical protein